MWRGPWSFCSILDSLHLIVSTPGLNACRQIWTSVSENHIYWIVQLHPPLYKTSFLSKRRQMIWRPSDIFVCVQYILKYLRSVSLAWDFYASECVAHILRISGGRPESLWDIFMYKYSALACQYSNWATPAAKAASRCFYKNTRIHRDTHIYNDGYNSNV